jgi:hypothetical protein
MLRLPVRQVNERTELGQLMLSHAHRCVDESGERRDLIALDFCNSCTVCRANFVRCCSNTGIRGRRGSQKEKFPQGPTRF